MSKKANEKLKQTICDICEASLTNSDIFCQHILCHAGEKPFKCDICPAYFLSKSLMFLHYSTVHKIVFDSQYTTNSTIHKCDDCNKEYRLKMMFAKHYMKHLQTRPYACETCKIYFLNPLNLLAHSHVHKNENFRCDICSENYAQKLDLIIHVQSHTFSNVDPQNNNVVQNSLKKSSRRMTLYKARTVKKESTLNKKKSQKIVRSDNILLDKECGSDIKIKNDFSEMREKQQESKCDQTDSFNQTDGLSCVQSHAYSTVDPKNNEVADSHPNTTSQRKDKYKARSKKKESLLNKRESQNIQPSDDIPFDKKSGIDIQVENECSEVKQNQQVNKCDETDSSDQIDEPSNLQSYTYGTVDSQNREVVDSRPNTTYQRKDRYKTKIKKKEPSLSKKKSQKVCHSDDVPFDKKSATNIKVEIKSCGVKQNEQVSSKCDQTDSFDQINEPSNVQSHTHNTADPQNNDVVDNCPIAANRSNKKQKKGASSNKKKSEKFHPYGHKSLDKKCGTNIKVKIDSSEVKQNQQFSKYNQIDSFDHIDENSSTNGSSKESKITKSPVPEFHNSTALLPSHYISHGCPIEYQIPELTVFQNDADSRLFNNWYFKTEQQFSDEKTLRSNAPANMENVTNSFTSNWKNFKYEQKVPCNELPILRLSNCKDDKDVGCTSYNSGCYEFPVCSCMSCYTIKVDKASLIEDDYYKSVNNSNTTCHFNYFNTNFNCSRKSNEMCNTAWESQISKKFSPCSLNIPYTAYGFGNVSGIAETNKFQSSAPNDIGFGVYGCTEACSFPKNHFNSNETKFICNDQSLFFNNLENIGPCSSSTSGQITYFEDEIEIVDDLEIQDIKHNVLKEIEQRNENTSLIWIYEIAYVSFKEVQDNTIKVTQTFPCRPQYKLTNKIKIDPNDYLFIYSGEKPFNYAIFSVNFNKDVYFTKQYMLNKNVLFCRNICHPPLIANINKS